jgi:hypothetical protein
MRFLPAIGSLQVGGDTLVVLLERAQLHSSLDDDAPLSQCSGENAFGLVLGEAEGAEGSSGSPS